MRATISRAVELDVGHRVHTHNGKCASPHGHRYRVTITVGGEVPDSGMVLDFGILGELLAKVVHDPYDHAFVVAADDLVMRHALDRPAWKVVVIASPPTAENLACVWGEAIAAELFEHHLDLERITVAETPNSLAEWKPAG